MAEAILLIYQKSRIQIKKMFVFAIDGVTLFSVRLLGIIILIVRVSMERRCQ